MFPIPLSIFKASQMHEILKPTPYKKELIKKTLLAFLPNVSSSWAVLKIWSGANASTVSLRLFGLIFNHLYFLLAIQKCYDHLLSVKKSHQISALRPHSLPLCSLKTCMVTSAAQRAKWQVEKPILLNHAQAQSLFNLLCLKSECISENIHGCLQAPNMI